MAETVTANGNTRSNTSTGTTAKKVAKGLGFVASWPPLVYVILGAGLFVIWALGTSVQVLTSEAWMMSRQLKNVDFNAWGQLWDMIRGQLNPDMYVPATFGWGVQIALIIASVGVELPREPAWRYWLCWFVVGLMIFVNGCGDWASSDKYGPWGQAGFTTVVFFMTFCMLMFVIMCWKHAIAKFREPGNQAPTVQ